MWFGTSPTSFATELRRMRLCQAQSVLNPTRRARVAVASTPGSALIPCKLVAGAALASPRLRLRLRLVLDAHNAYNARSMSSTTRALSINAREFLAVDDGAGQEPLHSNDSTDSDCSGSISMRTEQLQLWEQQIHALVVVLISAEHVEAGALKQEVSRLQGYDDWGYYGKWAAALAQVLVKQCLIDADALDKALGSRSPHENPTFEVGDPVWIKESPGRPASQWRRPFLPVPGSASGLCGTVARRLGLRADGSFFALQRALGLEVPTEQCMYLVHFDSEALSKQGLSFSGQVVAVEVFQSWLEAEKPDFTSKLQPGAATVKAPKGPKRRHMRQSLKTLSQEMHDAGLGPCKARPPEAKHEPHDERHEEPHEHLPRSAVEQAAVEKEGRETPGQRVTEALLKVLTARGIIALSAISRAMEVIDSLGVHPVGPRIVARAWYDANFKSLLLKDANAAIKSMLGHEAASSTSTVKIKVVESTPAVHNLVVCTLCSCYPVTLLGLSPAWYKSREYREQAVDKPRELLKSFGIEVPQDVELRVHDSNSELRYLVLPQRPTGTEGWSEEQLAALVTRDSMIGVALPQGPELEQAPEV